MSEPNTVVGAQTHIIGNLRGDGDLTVTGRVDGAINLSQTLTVEPSGIVVADVDVETAVISGAVVGNVTAADLIQIQPEGRVVGDLTAARVVLSDGASFRGNVQMKGVEGAPQGKTRTADSKKQTQNGVAASGKSRAGTPSAKPPVSPTRRNVGKDKTTRKVPRPRTAAGKKVRARRR